MTVEQRAGRLRGKTGKASSSDREGCGERAGGLRGKTGKAAGKDREGAEQ